MVTQCDDKGNYNAMKNKGRVLSVCMCVCAHTLNRKASWRKLYLNWVLKDEPELTWRGRRPSGIGTAGEESSRQRKTV